MLASRDTVLLIMFGSNDSVMNDSVLTVLMINAPVSDTTCFISNQTFSMFFVKAIGREFKKTFRGCSSREQTESKSTESNQ